MDTFISQIQLPDSIQEADRSYAASYYVLVVVAVFCVLAASYGIAVYILACPYFYNVKSCESFLTIPSNIKMTNFKSPVWSGAFEKGSYHIFSISERP